VLPRFVGEIDQVPPAYSAIKVDGERAYDLARAGETVELESRKVTIHSARVGRGSGRRPLTLEIECGKGTYVRAIVRDLAETLGALRPCERPPTDPSWGGSPRLRRSISLEMLEALGHNSRALRSPMLPVETALDDIPALAMTEAQDAFRLKPRPADRARSPTGGIGERQAPSGLPHRFAPTSAAGSVVAGLRDS
jgi:tRNA pseudouridine55 synthase